ncbi:MAG: isochorismatase family protein [Anaerolineales bacterium]
MKKRYFSLENIEQEAHELLQKVPLRNRKRAQTYNPTSSALLILDMQSYFLEPTSHAFLPSAPAIVPGLKALAEAYFANNLNVIFTQHLNTIQDAGSMGVWWRDLITIENPLSAIIPEFDYSHRFILRKNQYDAFYGTSLEEILRKKNVSQVVISGVMTHLCCETTARSAFVRGFEVFFLVDGTATYNQDHHLATLLNLAQGCATPVLTSELQAALQAHAEG